jgi:NAD(P)H-dependent FMN reductase
MQPVHLLLASGSLQRVSANRARLAVAARCAEADARLAWFDGIAEIPHFDTDLVQAARRSNVAPPITNESS